MFPKIINKSNNRLFFILVTFFYVVWKRGFTEEDRVLFRRDKGEAPTLPEPSLQPPPEAARPDR